MWTETNSAAPIAPRDRGTLFKRQGDIAIAGQRHPHPAVLRQQVAKLARKGQRQILFAAIVPDTPGAPGSRPPWPGSIRTIGRPGTLASVIATSATPSRSATVSPPCRASPNSASPSVESCRARGDQPVHRRTRATPPPAAPAVAHPHRPSMRLSHIRRLSPREALRASGASATRHADLQRSPADLRHSLGAVFEVDAA